jgi:non-homologous end joining protein Ku
MTYLHRFGVTEISTRVLKFYCKLISKEASDTNQGLVSDLYDKSLQSLISIQPEIVSAKKTQDFSENELELIRTIIDCLAIVK